MAQLSEVSTILPSGACLSQQPVQSSGYLHKVQSTSINTSRGYADQEEIIICYAERETENKRPTKSQKVGQASVHEQSRQEGGLVNTAAPESNPTTRIVETLQNVMDLAATEHEAWKTNYRTTVRPTKQSNIASGPKETLVSSEPSTKPGPPLPTTTKKSPRTDQENQRLAALGAEDDGKPPIKPELKSEHPARPPPLPNTTLPSPPEQTPPSPDSPTPQPQSSPPKSPTCALPSPPPSPSI